MYSYYNDDEYYCVASDDEIFYLILIIPDMIKNNYAIKRLKHFIFIKLLKNELIQKIQEMKKKNLILKVRGKYN